MMVVNPQPLTTSQYLCSGTSSINTVQQNQSRKAEQTPSLCPGPDTPCLIHLSSNSTPFLIIDNAKKKNMHNPICTRCFFIIHCICMRGLKINRTLPNRTLPQPHTSPTHLFRSSASLPFKFFEKKQLHRLQSWLINLPPPQK